MSVSMSHQTCCQYLKNRSKTVIFTVIVGVLFGWNVFYASRMFTGNPTGDPSQGQSTIERSVEVRTLQRKTQGVTITEEHPKQTYAEVKEEAEYQRRILRYQDVCVSRKRSVKSRDNTIYYSNPANNHSLSYCSVPKAGCTFWARIFQFLNRPKDLEQSLKSPLAISRFQVYYKPVSNLQSTPFNDDVMSRAERFFFVRDPYARLLSAYVDKFVLPQFLTWGTYAKWFASKNGSMPGDDRPCVKNQVTFSEFVARIVLSGDQNLHWKPIHTLCDPCKLYPHFIGKQETFSHDAKYILKKVGLEHLMTKYSHNTYVSDEIKQLVDFTFAFHNIDNYLKKCFSDVDIASRLWSAFQVNGYLPRQLPFPVLKFESFVKDSSFKDKVTRVILDENTRAAMSKEEHSKQKRDMLVSYFQTLSRDVAEKVAEKYDIDFEMFGYEKYPRDLFPWRYQ